MDPVRIAQSVTAILAFHLTKSEGKLAEDASKSLWTVTRKKLGNRPSAAPIVREFATNAGDSNVQEAFARELQKALNVDPKFAKKVAELVQQVQSSDESNVAGDSASRSFSIGNKNNFEQRLPGDATIDAPPPEDD